MMRQFAHKGLLILALLGAFAGGFLWHRAGLPPAGMGLADGRTALPGRPPHMDARMALFDAYPARNRAVVMLGDSITEGADWGELLARSDVANRGISNDTLSGFGRRIRQITDLHPRLIFVMGGINDVLGGKDADAVFADYVTLLAQLRSSGAVVIVQSTLLTSRDALNTKVAELNRRLAAHAAATGLPYLDVNSVVAENDRLGASFTWDGLHLSAAGYAAWSALVQRTLAEHGL